ncbi:hypothetical protein [Burkholderia savannae]|uniref:hypothetical protein n=1 Tax=Burkholderia savannae TaxID=1637837 RepID=UPI001E597BB2|nr:hypothetical protein [Burkholderia savannae]
MRIGALAHRRAGEAAREERLEAGEACEDDAAARACGPLGDDRREARELQRVAESLLAP